MVGMEATSLRFSAVARTLGAEARHRNLLVPGFRSPPRVLDAERTLRRLASGEVTVAVRLRDRPFVAVVADMIEGLVLANELSGTEATRLRTGLWEAVVAAGDGEVRAA